MPVAFFCFIVAPLAALGGMSLGIWMGLNEDFNLAPAHAHLNLLGWVTMSLYGLYHRGVERRDTRLAWVQVISGAGGFVFMAGGLGVMLAIHDMRVVPVIIIGALLCLTSMVLFLAIVLTDATRSAMSRLSSQPQRGYGW